MPAIKCARGAPLRAGKFLLMLGLCATVNAVAQVPVEAHADQSAMLVSADAHLAANKRLVYDFWREVIEAGHVDAADKYLTESYIQHNPTVPTGRAGFKQFFAKFAHATPVDAHIKAPLVAIVAEGDYVVLSFVQPVGDVDSAGAYTTTWFDMFRVADGRIAEHWDPTLKPAAAATAPGAFREVGDYRRLLSMFATEMKAPDLAGYRYLHTGYKVLALAPGAQPSDVRFLIKAQAGDIALNLDEDGTLPLPLDEHLREENPHVDVNQPKGTVAFVPCPRMSAPPAQQFNYDLFGAMTSEFDDWLAKIDVAERERIPHPKELVIRFAENSSAVARIAAAQGEVQLHADAHHEIRIAQNDAWKQANARITLDAMPVAIEVRME